MNTIDMRPVKDVLTTKTQKTEIQGVFNAELAARLNDELLPEGVAMGYMLFMLDLSRGRSGFTRPLPAKLLGYPAMVHALLGKHAQLDIVAALPDEHKDAVRAAFAEFA